MGAKGHWESVYRAKRVDEVSWFQREPAVSYGLIRRVAAETNARIIDVGGGASSLVDALAGAGYSAVTVLDISGAALGRAQGRLGAAASLVTWLEADARAVSLPQGAFDVWHDRALFHFLTGADRTRGLRGANSAIAAAEWVCGDGDVCRGWARQMQRTSSRPLLSVDVTRRARRVISTARKRPRTTPHAVWCDAVVRLLRIPVHTARLTADLFDASTRTSRTSRTLRTLRTYELTNLTTDEPYEPTNLSTLADQNTQDCGNDNDINRLDVCQDQRRDSRRR
jgi:SAM-dependent methyltransferase